MKKLNLLFIALAMVLTACSSDDTNPPNTEGDLLGTWIGQDVQYTGTSATEVQGQSITADFVGDAYDVNYTLTFTENPNEVVADGSYSIELTTTALGQSQTQNVEDLEFLNSGTWSRSGNQLSITDNGETTVGTIVELTVNTLKIAVTETEDVVEQGISASSNIDIEMTYTRM
ncbi:lipocalin family protein [Psychroserpens algicola]|uniref:lipocalin family protein n=1 Tax=Psychroserpens algicola TaxID=1719034 RepID=UPI0019538E7C|nr:lipocalin family protein [Psychroserpens algicola]